jgi:hypothetical protein
MSARGDHCLEIVDAEGLESELSLVCSQLRDRSPPFGGPQAVLDYLSRYTHRVAIANSRLITCDRDGVTFRWKDYRRRRTPDRELISGRP